MSANQPCLPECFMTTQHGGPEWEHTTGCTNAKADPAPKYNLNNPTPNPCKHGSEYWDCDICCPHPAQESAASEGCTCAAGVMCHRCKSRGWPEGEKTCGELSSDECNGRYFALRAENERLKAVVNAQADIGISLLDQRNEARGELAQLRESSERTIAEMQAKLTEMKARWDAVFTEPGGEGTGPCDCRSYPHLKGCGDWASALRSARQKLAKVTEERDGLMKFIDRTEEQRRAEKEGE